MSKLLKRATSVLSTGVILFGCLSITGCKNENAESSKPSDQDLSAVREALIDKTETVGLTDIKKMELYENGNRISGDKMNISRDNHKIYYTDTVRRIVAYADGYQIDLPVDWQLDYSLGALRDRYTSSAGDVILTISKEENTYGWENKKYINENLNKYIIDPNWRKANNITLLGDITTTQHGKYNCEIIKEKIEGMEANRPSYYTYVTFYNDSMRFYRMMFKSVKELDVSAIVNSFQPTVPQGATVNNFNYELKIPENWSQETKDYYNKLQNSNKVDWGIFTSYLETTGYSKTIPALEKAMDYKFPVISQYIHYGYDFPLDFANKVNNDGCTLQMSYQFTTNNNTNLATYLPSLDIYRGTEKSDAIMRKFAKQIKEYGKPLLFRLNNEMNTDWTSYCGLANMVDPDIFIEDWKILYNIFQEEGVNNAIWIFNGTEGSYPPGNWSNYLNYLPPSDYVNMIGLTGYNTGNEKFPWRSYQTIYDKIKTDYDRYFSKWPWIISEFGCGYNTQAEGGKAKQAQWVKEMFDNISQNRYPNIKVAIWFSANDYNDDNTIQNAFALEVNNTATMEAFKDGLARTH